MGKVYSFRLLPTVIGQALEGEGRTRKHDERVQEVREAQLDSEQDKQRCTRLIEVYDAISAGKRETHTANARESLLQQGGKQQFLLGTRVRAEGLSFVREMYSGREE